MNRDERECRALLSKNIKRFRSRLGFSQLDLALELDISTTFLSEIEIGKKWVSPDTLARIAKVLKVEIFELFRPEAEETAVEIQVEIQKYLAIVDDTLVKHITHSIQGAVESSIPRAVAKMRSYYKGKG
jgi:transcriptional regulator with XRE-family HTH domain